MKRKLIVAALVVIVLLALAVAINPRILLIPFALASKYGGMRTDSTLAQAHERAVNSFVESEGFGLSRLRHLSMWNDRIVYFEGREYQPWRIQLIGLSTEMGDRIYTSMDPPKKDEIKEAHWRELSFEENSAVAELRKGMSLSSPIPLDLENHFDIEGSMRVLAPLRLSQSCIECHEGKSGDIVGAFAYTLMLEYQSEAEESD